MKNLGGHLRFNPNGRWSIDDDELTSGDVIQIRCAQGSFAVWFDGRIEHGVHGYYFLWLDINGGPGQVMELAEGTRARRSD